MQDGKEAVVKCAATLAARSKEEMTGEQLNQVAAAVFKECEKKAREYRLLVLPSLAMLLEKCPDVNQLDRVFDLVGSHLGFTADKDADDAPAGFDATSVAREATAASMQQHEFRILGWRILVRAIRNASPDQVGTVRKGGNEETRKE